MKTFFQSIGMLVIFTIITGVLYPVGLTIAAQVCFPNQANGSLIKKDGKIRGSELLAQKFTDPKYFWPRPSAADYATVASGASNLGPTSSALTETVKVRAADFRKANQLNDSQPVPSEMVFASGSGLDPHISPESAWLQLKRIAVTRGIPEEKIKQLIEKYTQNPQFGFLGEKRVNALRLNLALDTDIKTL